MYNLFKRLLYLCIFAQLQTGLAAPESVQAPVCGDIKIGEQQPGKWTGLQHGGGYYLGINRANDNMAWDINFGLKGDDDCSLGSESTCQTVYAVEDGCLHKANGWGGDTFGQLLINHTSNGENWSSAYLHMINKTTKNCVTKGEAIGLISDVSAQTIGDHLHFAVYDTHGKDNLVSVNALITENKCNTNKISISPILSMLLLEEKPYKIVLLNDTGITWAGNSASGNSSTCSSNFSAPQDCDAGRDFTQNFDNNGHAGFAFTKLGPLGEVLPSNITNWMCVRDNVTGLIWEVKRDDDSIHDKDNKYRWGGKTAKGQNFGNYFDDWNALVDGSNNEKHCGFDNWRVPTIDELQSIVNYNGFLNTIDSDYFPNSLGPLYWTSSPKAITNEFAWNISFSDGSSSYFERDKYLYVRLVRSND